MSKVPVDRSTMMGLRKRGKVKSENKESDIEEYNQNSNWMITKSRRKYFHVTLPIIAPLALFMIGYSLFFIASFLNNRLPGTFEDEILNHSFSAKKALHYLEQLTDIGPKVVGSVENEVLAIKFITDEINKIMSKAAPIHKIKYNLQKVSSSFYLSIKNKECYNYYTNLQNIVVKIGPHTPTANISLLLNCHFDSVPGSPGSSDDGLNCAVMLEILRVLSVENTKMPHNVIFLFNGAEEAMLLASHGFITHHPWAKEVKAFINLESCGAGGRESLFQSGPNHPWLIKKYGESVPHPSGTVLGEELFQTGLIPSDTDFRIFRDFGKIPGLDFAHYDNGYVYHTRYDRLESIENVLGVLQHTGDNILALTKSLIGSKEIENTEADEVKSGQQVYFDLMGLVFLNFSTTSFYITNIIVAILSFITIIFMYLKIMEGKNYVVICMELLLRILISFGTLTLAILYNLSVGYFLGQMNTTMSWYTHSVWLIPMYFIPPVVIKSSTYILLCLYQKESPQIQAQSLCLSTQCMWTICLILGTLLGIRSTFIILIQVFPCVFTSGLIATLGLHKTSSKSSWLLIYLTTSMVSSVYMCYCSIQTFKVFFPIAGRMGSEKNPELIIGLLATVLSVLMLDYLLSISVVVQDGFLSIFLLCILHLLSIVIICATPLGFPYGGNQLSPTPQRVIAQHVERIFYNKMGGIDYKDAGFEIESLDHHGVFLLPDILIEKHTPQKYQSSKSKHILWIPADPPTIDRITSLDLYSVESLPNNTRRFYFFVSGPDHMEFEITPISGRLVAWSLDKGVPNVTSKEPEKSYFVRYVHGLSNGLWSFHLDLQATDEWNDEVVKIQTTGSSFHDTRIYSNIFLNIISSFESWSHITSFVSSRKTYVF